MKSVMLTGTTGFIGSHIAEHLVQKKIDTRLFVRRRNSIIDSLENRGAKIYLAQSDNMARLKASLSAAEVVIHCAGATRALQEKDYIKANVDFTTNILRPSVVYGPRERDVYNYFRLIKKGIFILLGDGNKRFSILHVNDLVSAVMICAKHPSCGETYFVCNDEAPSWLEIGDRIKKALSKEHTLTVKIPEHAADIAARLLDAIALFTRTASLLNRQKIIEAKQAAWLCSNTKIKNRLHWKPEISLENGIRQTTDWYIMENWI